MAKAPGPAQQLGVAGGRGRHAGGVQAPAEGVLGDGDVDLGVGIIALSTVLNQLVVSRTNGTNLCPLIASLPTVPHCSTSIHTAMQALGITLDPEPLALPSTRNRLRTALHRWCLRVTEDHGES